MSASPPPPPCWQLEIADAESPHRSVRQSLESFVEQAMVEYSFSGTITERRGSKGAITAISGALPCKNGHWVISQIHRPGRWDKIRKLGAGSGPQLGSIAGARREPTQASRLHYGSAAHLGETFHQRGISGRSATATLPCFAGIDDARPDR